MQGRGRNNIAQQHDMFCSGAHSTLSGAHLLHSPLKSTRSILMRRQLSLCSWHAYGFGIRPEQAQPLIAALVASGGLDMPSEAQSIGTWVLAVARRPLNACTWHQPKPLSHHSNSSLPLTKAQMHKQALAHTAQEARSKLHNIAQYSRMQRPCNGCTPTTTQHGQASKARAPASDPTSITRPLMHTAHHARVTTRCTIGRTRPAQQTHPQAQ